MSKRIAKTPCKGGVYRITCKATGKSYIGSTFRPLEKRWREHLKELRSGYHHSQYLQRAWNRHGEDSFEFCILEPIQFVEDLIDCEQKWMDIYQAYDNRYGYNIVPRADRRAISEETKAKISATLTGRTIPREIVEKASIARTGRKCPPETRAKISAAHKGRKKSPEAIAKTAAALRGVKRKPRTKEHAIANIESRFKRRPFCYQVTSPDGTVYERVDNLTEFCRLFGLSISCMVAVANGRRKSSKGWTCVKVDKQ